jgi:hypothetical protein
MQQGKEEPLQFISESKMEFGLISCEKRYTARYSYYAKTSSALCTHPHPALPVSNATIVSYGALGNNSGTAHADYPASGKSAGIVPSLLAIPKHYTRRPVGHKSVAGDKSHLVGLRNPGVVEALPARSFAFRRSERLSVPQLLKKLPITRPK